MKRAILFDMDGVLVDSYAAWFALLRQAAQTLGCVAFDRDAFAAHWGQGIDGDVEVFFPTRTAAELEAFYNANFARHVHHVVTTAGAAALLDVLKTKQVATAVITNTPQPLAELTLQHAQLHPDLIVGASMQLEAKPSPAMLLEALRRLEVDATDALMVGDSRYDQAAAMAAGVAFVGFGGLRAEVSVGSLAEVLALLDA